MSVAGIFLGLIALFFVVILGVGFAEYIVEDRQDRKKKQEFHMKHLDDINHERK